MNNRKIIQKAIINSLVIFGLVFCIFQSQFVFAEEETASDVFKKMSEKSKMKSEIVADVNIRNAEISEIKKNNLKLIFDVENSMEIQSNLIYGLELVKKQESGETVISDTQIFRDDKITIEKGRIIKKEIEYKSPEYLSGDYTLWLKIKDESGLILALQSFAVNLSGTGMFIEQGNPCYLTIEGEKEKYSLSQGVSVRKEEKLFLECQTKNLSEGEVFVLPSFEFYRRDFYGEKTGTYQASQKEAIVFANNEEKLTKIAISLPKDPQAYDVKIVLLKEGSAVSNPVLAHFVLSGKSGTIINASLDKSQYKSSEKAQLTLLWAGPADTFFGSRAGGSVLIDPNFEVEISSQGGKNICSTKSNYKAGELRTILDVPIQKDCDYPAVNVKLLDGGVILYEKTITTEPEKRQLAEPKTVAPATVNASSSKKSFVVIIVGLIFILILVWVYVNKKLSGGNKMLILMFIVGCSMFFRIDNSQAVVAVLKEDPFWINYTDPTFIPAGGEAIGVDVTTCAILIPSGTWLGTNMTLCNASNPTGLLYPCYAPGKMSLWDGGSHYICYQTIISYTYGLNNTSVSQGATITASGTSSAVNVCNNGQTSGMIVSKQNVSGVYDWIINPTYASASSGSFPFSTSGWTCGNYTAAFAYAFKHGTSSSVTDFLNTYTKAGGGNISYTVNNCCSAPTCASGPGCRTTALTNGTTTAQTCCSGSCYACNSDYTWNGSMCVLTCQTWDLLLAASPSSGAASLTSNLTATLSGIFGGDTYTYSNYNCGAGGPSPTNISGRNFTCVYTSSGTYYPSVTATAQSSGCVHNASSSVTVTAAVATYSCTESIPSGSTMCIGDDTSLTSSIAWKLVGASSASCTATRKCEYYTPPNCASWSLSLAANPVSGSAPLTTNIVSSIGAASGGETYIYSNQSCGVDGPTPTNVSDGNFTCVYPSLGTYQPSIKVTAQSTGCVNIASTTVIVSAAALAGVCGPAATTYPMTATTFSGAFCSSGAASPASPVFPTAITPTTWTCLSLSGGASSPICTAYKSSSAPILTLTANPNPVVYNTASNLTWTVSGATSCWATGDWTNDWKMWTGGTESTGNLTAAKTYSLECWGAGGSSGIKSVTVTVGATPGVCGPAATIYPMTATTFSGAFCSSGTASPASPVFPTATTSTTWTCLGLSGGANSPICTATKSCTHGTSCAYLPDSACGSYCGVKHQQCVMTDPTCIYADECTTVKEQACWSLLSITCACNSGIWKEITP